MINIVPNTSGSRLAHYLKTIMDTNKKEIKIEYIIRPLQVWRERVESRKVTILAISNDKEYIIVSGVIDEVSPLFHKDFLIKNYVLDSDFN